MELGVLKEDCNEFHKCVTGKKRKITHIDEEFLHVLYLCSFSQLPRQISVREGLLGVPQRHCLAKRAAEWPNTTNTSDVCCVKPVHACLKQRPPSIWANFMCYLVFWRLEYVFYSSLSWDFQAVWVNPRWDILNLCTDVICLQCLQIRIPAAQCSQRSICPHSGWYTCLAVAYPLAVTAILIQQWKLNIVPYWKPL